MDFNQVRYFLALSRTLNFTRAARESGISQPSLTNAIRKLEDELGGTLIYRDGKDTRLTELGRVMQEEFLRLKNQVEDIHEIAQRAAHGDTHVVKIGVTETLCAECLASFVEQVSQQIPEALLRFHTILPQQAADEILSGGAQICFTSGGSYADEKLLTLPLFTERLLLALPRQHSYAKQEFVTHEQLMTLPYLERTHCPFRSQLVEYFMDNQITMLPQIHVQREDLLQSFVAHGLGVCVLPETRVVHPEIVVRPVAGMNLTWTINAVAVFGSANLPVTRQILKLAQQHDWQST